MGVSYKELSGLGGDPPQGKSKRSQSWTTCKDQHTKRKIVEFWGTAFIENKERGDQSREAQEQINPEAGGNRLGKCPFQERDTDRQTNAYDGKSNLIVRLRRVSHRSVG